MNNARRQLKYVFTLVIALGLGLALGYQIANHDWKARIRHILSVDLRMRHAEGEVVMDNLGTERADDPCRAERDQLHGLRSDLQRIADH